MSPVLKKRHSKSYVPLFSKNQGFALLHIPFLSTFLQSKKQLPFRNCFSVYSLFYYFIFRTHFLYHVVLYQQKRFLLKLLQMKYHTPLHIIRHGFKVQRGINRMQLLLCVIRFTNHSPKVNHTILLLPVRKGSVFWTIFIGLSLSAQHRWKYPSLVPGEMV